jgi:hypothetical protein
LTAEYTAAVPTQPVRHVQDIGPLSATRLIRRTIADDFKCYLAARSETRRAYTIRRILRSIYPRITRPILIIGRLLTFLGITENESVRRFESAVQRAR